MSFLETPAIDDAACALVDVIEEACKVKGLRIKSFAVIVMAEDGEVRKIGCIESGCTCAGCTRDMIETFAEARGAKVEHGDDDSADVPAQAVH